MKATSEWTPDVALETILQAQRSAIESAFGVDAFVPAIGDVWLANATYQIDKEQTLNAMLVILRSFTETWSAHPFFDVAPISDDQRLASEWSLIFDAATSGLGIPLVVHIDVQTTTTSSMLGRRVGRLSDLARRDLEAIMRAYALGEISVELSVGRTGTINIRFHPEWDAFARQLVRLSQELAAPLREEQAPCEEYDYDAFSESLHPLLSVASGQSVGREWEYKHTAPFVLCRNVANPTFTRLGDAVAAYFRYQTSLGIEHGTYKQLTEDSFLRLRPFFDASLKMLTSAENTVVFRSRLFESINSSTAELQLCDLQILVESMRWFKIESAKRRAIIPMSLAARRSRFE
jgi:hypothetical protein